MSRSATQSANPVQLFPFLAVLLCTMGTLIVMLIVVSQKIRQDTIAKAIADSVEALETTAPVVEPPAAIVIESESAVPSPSGQDAELAAVRARLTELEEHSGRLEFALRHRRRMIQSLGEQLAAARTQTEHTAAAERELEGHLRSAIGQRDANAAALQQLRREQETLRRAILESQRLIAERQKKDDGNSRYVIIPYDGVTGTTRRPIILECTDTGIRFVAEKIEIRAHELQRFSAEDNPLLAGAQELVRFWSSYNAVQDNPQQEPKPYVLLLVRPNGTIGYYVARRFLEDLKTEFGYELVTNDFEFDVPETDPRATELCRAAVERALARRPVTTEQRVDSFAQSFNEELRAKSLRGETVPPPSPSGGAGSGKTFSSITDSGRQIERFDSQALVRSGGTASQRFFSSLSFRDHRERIESGDKTTEPGSPDYESGQGNVRSRALNIARKGQGPGAAPDPAVPPPAAQLQTQENLATQNRRSFQEPRPFEFTDDETPLVATPQQANPLLPESSAGTRKNGSQSGGLPHESPGFQENVRGSHTDRLREFPGVRKSTRSPGNPNSSRSAQEESPSDQAELSPLMRSRDIKDLRAFKRQWGISNPKATIALEHDITVTLTARYVVISDQFKITRTDDRSLNELTDWTIQAIDVVARDWGTPPERFYWVPAVDLAVEAGGELLIEPMKRALERTGASVNVRYEPTR